MAVTLERYGLTHGVAPERRLLSRTTAKTRERRERGADSCIGKSAKAMTLIGLPETWKGVARQCRATPHYSEPNEAVLRILRATP